MTIKPFFEIMNSLIEMFCKIINFPAWADLVFLIIFSVLYFFSSRLYISETEAFIFGFFCLFFLVSFILKFMLNFVKNNKKTFHMVVIPGECFCVVLKQEDHAYVTQFRFGLNVKNITQESIGLTGAKIIKTPKLGELVESSILTRSPDSHYFGSAKNGYLIPAKTILPVDIMLLFRREESKLPKNFKCILSIPDDEGNTQKVHIKFQYSDFKKGWFVQHVRESMFTKTLKLAL